METPLDFGANYSNTWMESIKPIIIIGAARSGTTLLGEILSQHSKLAYWLEPKYIWRFGNPGKKDDIRTPGECTPKVENYIKSRFRRYVIKDNKERLLEKTPSNCFRIEFINEIFPDAQFIHLVRDGRCVAVSAEKKWTTTPDPTAFKRRFIKMEIPFSEWPFYGVAILRDVFGRIFFPGKGYIWGPHFPGIREYRKQNGILKTCVEQWRQSVISALKQFRNIPNERIKTVYYEDLCRNPGKIISDILDFAGLKTESILEYADQRIKFRENEYSEGEIEKMDRIEPLIEDELKILGYHTK